MLARKRPGLVLGFILLLFLPAAVFAQNKTISGKVTDSKAVAVSGASVVAKGSTTGTSTNANGEFSLSVPEATTTLVVSSIGFTSIDVDITGKTSVDVSLADAANDLNEVVVIGYGTARKRDLTGSVSTVGSKDFNKGVFTAPDQLIQGKAPGVQVINNSGQPGGATTVRIRGASALTGSGQPLYVVDGIPLDNRSSRPGLDATNLGQTPGANPLNFLNPADIATMDILKDASATAIYGSRAAYGVVLITTKKGQSGQPKIDFNASVGASSIMRKMDVLDASQYRAALDYYDAPAANDKGASVDAMDELFRTAMMQNYNVAVSGGNENGRYRLSLGSMDQEGIIEKTRFKKYVANFSGSFKFLESKRLGVDFNIVASQTNEQLAPISSNAGATGSLISHILQWNPTEALYDANSPSGFNIKQGDIVNPAGMSAAYNDRAKTTTVLGSISPYFKITNWLEYRLLFSINYSTGNRRASIQQFINLADVLDRGFASIAQNELITQQATHTLNLNKEITSGLSLNGVIGYEYLKYTSKGSNMSGFGNKDNGGFGAYGLDYTNYIQVTQPNNRNIGSFADPLSELQSYFARAGLNYKDKYLLTATIRADGSSKFGENNKYGYFPSVGAAWNISNEDFFSKGFVNSLKLRAGWGKVGNQEFPAGSSLAAFNITANNNTPRSNNDNKDLKWQADRQYNVGVDFAILNNRITGSVDYFNKRTTDLLYPVSPTQPAPSTTVVTWKNLPGFVDNTGVEVAINANIVNKEKFSWDFGVFATFLDNNVTNLVAPIFTGGLHGQGVSGTFVQIITNDRPINSFYTRQFQGIDPQTGQAVYRDNGSSFFVGNPNAKTLLGLSTTLNYSKLSMTINMNGSFGQDIYNNTLNNVVSVGSIRGGRNIAVVEYEKPVKESVSNTITSSSRYIENGSYLKMANVTLSYNLGNIGRSFIRGANVFLTGQNLFVITKYNGFDPEVNTDKSNNGVPSQGIEYVPYPSARAINLGVNFSL